VLNVDLKGWVPHFVVNAAAGHTFATYFTAVEAAALRHG
jgi:hypothetical protein